MWRQCIFRGRIQMVPLLFSLGLCRKLLPFMCSMVRPADSVQNQNMKKSPEKVSI